jgi:hypothetical protein
MSSDWQAQPPQQQRQYPQQYPQQQQYPPQQQPAQHPAAKPKMPGWAIALLVISVLNLALAAYLVFFVVQAQIALSDLQRSFQSGFGGLGG